MDHLNQNSSPKSHESGLITHEDRIEHIGRGLFMAVSAVVAIPTAIRIMPEVIRRKVNEFRNPPQS